MTTSPPPIGYPVHGDAELDAGLSRGQWLAIEELLAGRVPARDDLTFERALPRGRAARGTGVEFCPTFWLHRWA